MTLEETMSRLKALGNPKMREYNIKQGARKDSFGINLSHMRALANEIKANHPLGLQLWQTGNSDAQLLATLLMKPRELSQPEVEAMMRDISYFKLVDWMMVNQVKKLKFKDALRLLWLDSEDEYAGRAAWSLETERVIKGGLSQEELSAILDRIEAELKDAPFRKQETMNYCLAEVGIRNLDLRDRAIAIGEKLGVFRDYPVQKGCISPFAPIWIREMSKRHDASA